MGWRGFALVALAGCSHSTTLYEGEVSLAPVVVGDDVYFGTIDGDEHAIRRIRGDADESVVRWRQRGTGAFGAGLAADLGTVVWSTPTDDDLVMAYRLVGYDRVEIGTVGTVAGDDWLVALSIDEGTMHVATRYAVASLPLQNGSLTYSCFSSPSEEITALAVRDGGVYVLAAARNALSSPVALLSCERDAVNAIVREVGVSPRTLAVRGGVAWLAGNDGLVRVDLSHGTSERLLDTAVASVHDAGESVYAVLGEPGDTRLVDVADPWTPLATGMTGVRAVAVDAHRIYYVDDDGLVAVER